MKIKAEVAGLIIGLVSIGVAVLAWLFPFEPAPNRLLGHMSKQLAQVPYAVPYAKILVSGTGIQLRIAKGGDGPIRRYQTISGVGIASTVYMQIGQYLTVDVSGTGIIVRIDSDLMPYVHIKNSGTGNLITQMKS